MIVWTGRKEKIQSPPVYTNPQLYPIHESDPSFKVYPQAGYFYQPATLTTYVAGLNATDQLTFSGLSPQLPTSIER